MTEDLPAAAPAASWSDVVALMRQDPRELGRDASHAPRFLRRYGGSMDALTAQFRRGMGLNAHEMQAITTLWEFGRMTMTELGRRIPLSRAAVTALTDRLEQVGFVRRIPDPADRRRILIEVTEGVEVAGDRVHHAWDDRVAAYVRELDPADWARVVDVLADLRDMAQAEAADLREQAMDGVERVVGGAKPKRATRSTEELPPSWW
ncbi:MAG: putative MarR family transcriptional regulator [Thermoleophilia bacterium]|nr:putative MarR family transcriptional regulator [Thermoleophilia bacterium]